MIELNGALEGLTEEQVLEILQAGVGEDLLSGPDVLISGGDDAALLRCSGSYLLSTDTMIENHDYVDRWPNETEQPAHSVAFKAIAQNVSDINAMGAETTGIFLSLSLPSNTTRQWLYEFGQGLQAACHKLGATRAVLAGGDLGIAEEVTITVTVTGEPGTDVLRRDTARPGDSVYVCGNLGTAAAALQHLLSNDTSELPLPKNTQFYPEPPLWAGPAAVQAGARCGMDLSDGLVRDIRRILRASSAASGQKLGVTLDVDALQPWLEPLTILGQRHGANPWTWVLNGGEDYALLTIASQHVQLPESFVKVGTIIETDQKDAVLFESTTNPELAAAQEALTIELGGWDHFA
ncbi:thiamine-phosphate kinase [Micrococcoides hystricis]|uniref:Thiamine-monophosphate kinase n=1 Tax=Micrococcoides hystricis TaxID=1572761 RepID=A0ABV6PE41_9MICC